MCCWGCFFFWVSLSFPITFFLSFSHLVFTFIFPSNLFAFAFYLCLFDIRRIILHTVHVYMGIKLKKMYRDREYGYFVFALLLLLYIVYVSPFKFVRYFWINVIKLMFPSRKKEKLTVCKWKIKRTQNQKWTTRITSYKKKNEYDNTH